MKKKRNFGIFEAQLIVLGTMMLRSTSSSSRDSINNLTQADRDAIVEKLLQILKSIDDKTEESQLEKTARIYELTAYTPSVTLSDYQQRVKEIESKLSRRITCTDRANAVKELVNIHSAKHGSSPNQMQIQKWAESQEAAIFFYSDNRESYKHLLQFTLSSYRSSQNPINTNPIISSSSSSTNNAAKSNMSSLTQDERNYCKAKILEAAEVVTNDSQEKLKRIIEEREKTVFQRSQSKYNYYELIAGTLVDLSRKEQRDVITNKILQILKSKNNPPNEERLNALAMHYEALVFDLSKCGKDAYYLQAKKMLDNLRCSQNPFDVPLNTTPAEQIAQSGKLSEKGKEKEQAKTAQNVVNASPVVSNQAQENDDVEIVKTGLDRWTNLLFHAAPSPQIKQENIEPKDKTLKERPTKRLRAESDPVQTSTLGSNLF